MRDDTLSPTAGRTSRRTPKLLFLSLVASLSLAAGPAAASDGRTEINQARALAGGVTAGDAPGFPVTIDAPGSYVLTSDLMVTDPSVHGIHVMGDNVSLDLAGHAVIGPRSCTGEGSAVTCDDSSVGGDGLHHSAGVGLRVGNGVIRGFFQGMHFLFSSSNACIIERMRVARNAARGVTAASSCVVLDSIADRNGDIGLVVSLSAIGRSIAVGNRDSGTFPGLGSVLYGSSSHLNGQYGVETGRCNVIANGTTSANEQYGVFLFGDSLVVGVASTRNGAEQLAAGQNVGYAQNVFLTDPAIPASALVLGGQPIGPNLCDGVPCP